MLNTFFNNFSFDSTKNKDSVRNVVSFAVRRKVDRSIFSFLFYSPFSGSLESPYLSGLES